MSARTVTRWRSGYCGTGHHTSCRGTYAGAECTCPCHAPAQPAPLLHGCAPTAVAAEVWPSGPPPLDQPLPVVKLVTCPRCRHDFAVPLEEATRG